MRPLITGLIAAATLLSQGKPEPSRPVPSGLSGAAALRNENVQVNLIDNDSLKEANIRLGTSVTIVSQPVVETGYYAAEQGRPPGELLVPRAAGPFDAWHGEAFEFHQNSVFNARKFFQAGPVRPSHQNRYGLRFTGAVPGLGSLTGAFSQRRSRGMINGNVLAPLESERTPLTPDPALRLVIGRYFAAYPTALPNRLDFDPRALNTNAPQRIDETDGSLRLDRTLAGGSLAASHAISRQRIDAFQLVAGQNPDTEVHGHRSRLGWTRQLNESISASLGMHFTRLKSVLQSEPNAVGPRVRFGYQIEELGPDSQFPIDRAVNSFRWGAVFRRHAPSSHHTLTWGAEASRIRLNGIETNNGRGLFWFSNNFGRTAIENLRWGAPTTYEVTVGEMARGFRNWEGHAFAADRWQATPRLELYYGTRFSFSTTPVEVRGLNAIPYGCDCNNFSPRFSIAWRGPGQWVMRTGYTVSFSGIPPVTYQQIRYNLPSARYLQVQNPDLLDPLRGIDLADPHGRTSPTVLAEELVSPYTHQFNWSLERRFSGHWLLRAGYVGSRTFKLLDGYMLNRAEQLPGGPAPTTANVDRRRADPRYYDVRYIVNAGGAWMDAAQIGLEFPSKRGLLWGVTYTFGKAIDTGADYSATAANNDLVKGRSQSQYEIHADRKGLSTFDSTHALMLVYSYDLPGDNRFARGWRISGSTLAKTGTPLTLFVGSDAPGFGNVDGGSGDRPNLVDPSILGMTIGNPDTSGSILRRDRFAYIAVGESRGNLGRNTFRKGGIFNMNAAVSREFRLHNGSGKTLIVRGEAFNLANRPQFDEPQRNLSSPAFGKITNTLNDGRVLQLGVRLVL